jgi:hypothetical protein
MSKTGILFGIAALALGIFLMQTYVAPSLTKYLAKL